ncbi:MAG: glycolate oxidase subunit GlcF [Caulobacterales bacterium]
MKTDLHSDLAGSPEAHRAKELISACVHCGFCNATCPTYQETSDERDGPRGRIYLIRQLLETGKASSKSRVHLDRCLTCRACETTCPSGVQYGKIADIGRGLIEKAPKTRGWWSALARRVIRLVVPFPSRFGVLLRLGRAFAPVLPDVVKMKIPAPQEALAWPASRHARRMLVLRGCVQASATPRTNAAAAHVLDHLGISLTDAPGAGCCGAASHHLSAHDEALGFARRNIDAWWPHVEAGVEAIVMTASGCGAMVADYGSLLADDPAYAGKARRISELTRDLSDVIRAEGVEKLPRAQKALRIAAQCPCTLQHALRQSRGFDDILVAMGVRLTPTPERHLCCGSAGTYSILQPELSQRLLARKLRALMLGAPERIATANVGCQLHLATKAEIPVQHWIEIAFEALQDARRAPGAQTETST